MKNTAKFLMQLLTVIGIMVVFTNASVFAAHIPLGGEDGQGEVVDDIYAEAKIPVPPIGESSDKLIEQVIMSGLGYAKVIIVAVGILFITIMGFQMVIGSENEEQLTTVKRGMIYTLVAFMIVSMSQDVAKIFDFSDSTILQNPAEILKRVKIWDKQVELIISFIKYIIASFACVMIVRSSVKLITSGGNDEETSKHRHSILYSAAGLLLVYAGDIFINKVFYVVNDKKYTGTKGIEWTVDAGQGVKELVGVTNMLVSFTGPIAVLMLVVAAIMYLGAGGKEENMEKAKRIIIAVVVGIVIIYGAFALVNTIILGKLPGNPVTAP